MSDSEPSTIAYRLSAVEKTLSELKDVVLENKMQSRDIQDLNKSLAEALKAINAHDKRIKELELRPMNEKAQKWQFIMDYIFKAAVTAVAGVLLVKIGLK